MRTIGERTTESPGWSDSMKKSSRPRLLREILVGVLHSASFHELADEFDAASDDRIEDLFLNTAVHEAGHAVAAIKMGLGITAVDIIPRATKDHVRLGTARVPMSERSRPSRIAGKGEAAAMPLLVYLIAGSLAELRVNERAMKEEGYAIDFKIASYVARVAICGRAPISEETRKSNFPLMKSAIAKATELADSIIASHRCATLRIAGALMENRRITGDEVSAIIDECDREKASGDTECKGSHRNAAKPRRNSRKLGRK